MANLQQRARERKTHLFVHVDRSAGSNLPPSISATLLSADPDLETKSSRSGRSQRGGGCFGHFNLAIEKILSGGESFESLAELMRSIYVEPEVAVQQISVGIVVELAPA